MSESRWSNLFNTPLGRLLIGFIKLALAGALIALVNSLSNLAQTEITIGNTTVPVGVVFQIIIAFFPILLLISALRDLGISL